MVVEPGFTLARSGVAVLMLFTIGQALAQGVPTDLADADIRLFRPAPSVDRYLWTDDAGAPDGLGGSAQVVLGYTDSPARYVSSDGTVTELLGSVWLADVQGAVSLDRLRADLDVPVVLRSSSDVSGDATGLGDVSLGLRGTLLDRRTAAVGLALSGRLQLPTATMDALLGESGVTGELGAIVERDQGNLRVAANLGTRLRAADDLAGASIDDELLARLGVGYAIGDSSGVGLDLGADAPLGDGGEGGGLSAEWLVSGWQELGAGWRLRAGAGSGLTASVGSPNLQLVAGIAWVGRAKDDDPDGDGIPTSRDVCPREPESFDGVRDSDGCPEGVPGAGAGAQAGDGVSLELPSGADDDGDGIPAFEDACLAQAEDFDGFEDGDGCPEPDNDADGVLDADDRCPLEAETINAFEDDDGCPEVVPDSVAEVSGAVEGILFASGSDRLLPASRTVLNKILAVLEEDPGLGVRIEGHTDDVGDRTSNLDLSRRRAAAVAAWLAERGIQADRMSTDGFGPDRPVAPNDSAANRALNRRVELSYARVATEQP